MVSQGYKVSLGFLECKDPRGRRDHRDRRVIPENQDSLAQKGQEGPQEQLATPETQDFPVFLAKMVPQAPQESQDATVQKEKEDRLGHLACLDSPEIPDHQGYLE